MTARSCTSPTMPFISKLVSAVAWLVAKRGSATVEKCVAKTAAVGDFKAPCHDGAVHHAEAEGVSDAAIAGLPLGVATVLYERGQRLSAALRDRDGTSVLSEGAALAHGLAGVKGFEGARAILRHMQVAGIGSEALVTDVTTMLARLLGLLRRRLARELRNPVTLAAPADQGSFRGYPDDSPAASEVPPHGTQGAV